MSSTVGVITIILCTASVAFCWFFIGYHIGRDAGEREALIDCRDVLNECKSMMKNRVVAMTRKIVNFSSRKSENP